MDLEGYEVVVFVRHPELELVRAKDLLMIMHCRLYCNRVLVGHSIKFLFKLLLVLICQQILRPA